MQTIRTCEFLVERGYFPSKMNCYEVLLWFLNSQKELVISVSFLKFLLQMLEEREQLKTWDKTEQSYFLCVIGYIETQIGSNQDLEMLKRRVLSSDFNFLKQYRDVIKESTICYPTITNILKRGYSKEIQFVKLTTLLEQKEKMLSQLLQFEFISKKEMIHNWGYLGAFNDLLNQKAPICSYMPFLIWNHEILMSNQVNTRNDPFDVLMEQENNKILKKLF